MSDQDVGEMQEATVTETDQPTQASSTGLSIQDLTLMVNVLEAVSQRGAIRPGEMQTVGALYTKLVSFLVANGALKMPQAEDTDKE